MMADQLGVEHPQWQQFMRWSNAVDVAASPMCTPEEKRDIVTHIRELNHYMLERKREKCAQPSDDMISVLSIGTLDRDGSGVSAVTDDEFLGVVQLLIAISNRADAYPEPANYARGAG
jgi:cytochrome P450